MHSKSIAIIIIIVFFIGAGTFYATQKSDIQSPPIVPSESIIIQKKYDSVGTSKVKGGNIEWTILDIRRIDNSELTDTIFIDITAVIHDKVNRSFIIDKFVLTDQHSIQYVGYVYEGGTEIQSTAIPIVQKISFVVPKDESLVFTLHVPDIVDPGLTKVFGPI